MERESKGGIGEAMREKWKVRQRASVKVNLHAETNGWGASLRL